MAQNTAATRPGSNEAPDYAQQVTDRLQEEYNWLNASVTEALDEARELPEKVEDDDIQGKYAHIIKRLRDLNGRIEALRVAEKEPHLRGGVAVDSFFGGLMSKLLRKNKTDKAGAADVLQNRVNTYVNEKAAAERRAREEEERRRLEEEARIRQERQAEERKQRELEEKAARARKEENREAAEKAAAEAEENARRLRDEEEAARASRQEAQADAAAKTADLVRTRTNEGHLVTAKQVPYIEITDEMALNPATLWAFVKTEHKLQALKRWAQVTGYKQQMPGAIIEMRDEAVIR